MGVKGIWLELLQRGGCLNSFRVSARKQGRPRQSGGGWFHSKNGIYIYILVEMMYIYIYIFIFEKDIAVVGNNTLCMSYHEKVLERRIPTSDRGMMIKTLNSVAMGIVVYSCY